MLFDTNDGGQIMVTYDAPPPASRPRQDNSTNGNGQAPSTAVHRQSDDTDGEQLP